MLPPLTLVVALLFFYLWHSHRKNRGAQPEISKETWLLVSGISWILYGCYETYMYFWAKSVTAPIRVDLLLITPFLYSVSIGGVISYRRGRKILRNSG